MNRSAILPLTEKANAMTVKLFAVGNKVGFEYPKSKTGELVNRLGFVESVRITDDGNGIITLNIPGLDHPKSFRVDRIKGWIQDYTANHAVDASEMADTIETQQWS